MTEWRPIVRAVGWVVVYLAAGLVLTALPFVLYIRCSACAGHRGAHRQLDGAAARRASLAQLAVFGFLTWLIGRRVLKLSAAELGLGHRTGREQGFGRGLASAPWCSPARRCCSASRSVARDWLPDAGGVLDYLRNVGLTTAVLAPAALAEEVAFRGLPLVLLASRLRARHARSSSLSLIFGLAHGLNPDVTPLAIGNVALAGVLPQPGLLSRRAGSGPRGVRTSAGTPRSRRSTRR